MHSVRNNLRPDALVGQNCPQNPGLSMIKIPHGIERMSRMGYAGIDSAHGLLESGIRVAHGNKHALRPGILNEFQRALNFRSQSNQLDPMVRDLEKLIKDAG